MEARIEEITAENLSIKEFIADRDATIVKEACSGLGTDNKALIEVLCSRTKTQLERVDQAYRAKYEETLWEKVKSDVGGNYKKMMRYALMERDEFVSAVIDEACSGLGTDEELLIDLLTPLTNEEIAAAKTHWEAKNDESLVDKLNSETSGGLRELIVSLVQGKRTESEEADEDLAEEQANNLYDAGVGKFMGTDDEVFIDIIGKSPSVQIQAIRAKYEESREMSLHKAIGKEFRGTVKAVLQSMLEPPVDFYCARLRKATKKMGTDEVAICRILGGNDKTQIAAISDRFMEKYDMTLSDMAKAELGGHFKSAVLAWVDPTADPTKGVEQQLLAEEPLPESEELLQLLETENENMKEYIAKVDAQQIRKACKGLGTDEKRLVSILCTRTKLQVERIDQVFREMYEMTLREQLESDMSGDLKTFMVYTQMETQEFDAIQMKQAMDGIGTDEDILIMILTTRSNEAIAAAQEYYEGRFDESLVDKIDSEMSGSFQALMLMLLRGERDEAAEADPDTAEAQAEALHDADGGDAAGVFAEILAKSSRAQVACIREAYESKYERSLAKATMKKFSGNMEDGLLSLLFDPIENFARGLKAAFHGIGTDNDAVCRILGGNDKPTCRAIAERYEEKYDRSLVDSLKKELRGTFERGAVTWVSAIDPAAGKEGFRLAAEGCAEDAEEEDGEAEEGCTAPDDTWENEEEAEDEQDEQEDVEDEGLEEAASRMLEEDEDAEGEDEEEDEEEEARQARMEAKREARAEKARRIQLRLAKTNREARAAAQKRKAAVSREKFEQKTRRMARLGREQVALASEKYGSEPIEGLTVWGNWDSELYVMHNEEVEGEHGWQHFRKNGFSQGKLVRIDNDFGAFVGLLDMSAYIARHEIDTSAVGNTRPFEESLVGFKHYVDSGRDEGLEIAITQVVPVYLLGEFDAKRYIHLHRDVKSLCGPARPGRFDDEGYRKLHPEVDEEEMEPFLHYKQNRRNEICVRGRVGFPNRRWYKEKYGKPFRHYFNRGHRNGVHIKIKATKLDPLSHYCRHGWEEGRPLWMLTGLGAFDGVLDVDAFLKVNPAAAESGMEPLEYLEQEGRDAGAKLPLVNITIRRVDAACLDGDTAVDAATMEEDEEYDDDEEDDEDDGDDDDDDDEDDDGDDDEEEEEEEED